ncbi:NAD(P)-dependent oxidoreductase [Bordetella sp. BOR01]|uniref:NAD(P)-dependent oxidoreductase n=1 Tax=Bordetella sp. BOR01 TaxID=2854779 RepID=UPI001C494F84|nr:NAD(P)-dependent oxidoreductase [Bordetella sp. BOR01]MBV7483759.1 NAD(P)-dependent oxidoreductase [Bordetella sp. BOR01]
MMTAAAEAIGFIGLGRMGSPMAMRLAQSGFQLVVCDLDPLVQERFRASGARVVDHPAAVADAARTTLLCLPDPGAVRSVVFDQDGLVHGKLSQTIVDLSTIGPGEAREIARGLQNSGKSYVDAPVTGGVEGAGQGNLTMMLGATEPVFQALRPVLSCMAARLILAGAEPGSGQLMKVLNNLLSFVALAATSEAMALGVKGGLSPAAMLDAFNHGSGRNSATEEKFPRAVLTRSFDFGFPVDGVVKDLELCLSEGAARHIPMPIGQSALQLWRIAAAERGNEDMTSIMKLFERWSGVEVCA